MARPGRADQGHSCSAGRGHAGRQDRGPLPAPDARASKRIAQGLRRWLLSPVRLQVFHTEGYGFFVQRDKTRREMATSGMRCLLATPSSLAGPVSAEPPARRIDEKTSKYRELSEKAGLPLIVAAGAHRFTGLSRPCDWRKGGTAA